MTIDIKNLDKDALFLRLYNHIQNETTFGNPEKALKSIEEAKELLTKNQYDYARFNLYCYLKKDEIDPAVFNNLYGSGKKIVEEIVSEMRGEMGFRLSKLPGKVMTFLYTFITWSTESTGITDEAIAEQAKEQTLELKQVEQKKP